MKGEILSIETAEKIARLEKRVKELEQINEEHKELNGKLRSELLDATLLIAQKDDEIRDLKADYGRKAQIERDTYKARIDKAVEYIKKEAEFSYDENCEILAGYEIEELLNILQNGEENE